MNDKKLKIWSRIMGIGAQAGCHQIPERSFFFKGYQFPICARCTGLIIGYAFAIATLVNYMPNIYIGIACSAIMFIDWFIQYIKILKSTNFRRLITGIAGGFGIIVCEFNFVYYLILLCNIATCT